MELTDHKNEEFVFIPGKEQVKTGRVRLRYNTCKDEYYTGTIETLSKQKKVFSRRWDSVAYSCQGIHRVFDKTLEEAYLERTKQAHNARISWKFDFTTTGLELDHVKMKMPFDEKCSGQVVVGMFGDTGSQLEPYQTRDGVFTSMKTLAGSKTLLITVNLLGEHEEQKSRIMTQSLMGDDTKCSFDVQIRLRRPEFTVGCSLLLFGLMYMDNIDDNTQKNRTKSEPMKTTGSIHIDLQNARRLPVRRRNGTFAAPKVKCTLQSEESTSSVKTKSQATPLDPQWCEFLTIPNVDKNGLRHSKMELQVKHSISLLRRSNPLLTRSKEVLGYVVLRQHHFLTYKDLNEEKTCTEDISHHSEDRIRNQTVSQMSLEKPNYIGNGGETHYGDNIAEYQQCRDDIIVQNVCGDNRERHPHGESTRDTIEKQNDDVARDIERRYSPCVSTDSNNNDFMENDGDYGNDGDTEIITFREKYYRDLLTADRFENMDEHEDDAFEILPSFNEFDEIQPLVDKYEKDQHVSLEDKTSERGSQKPKETINPKRRTISVDNSALYPSKNYKSRLLENFTEDTTGTLTEEVKPSRSHSMSDVIEMESKRRKKNQRKKVPFSNKIFKSSSISNTLEDSVFEEKASNLSHEHWNIVLSNPGQWFYCWHPLLGVREQHSGTVDVEL